LEEIKLPELQPSLKKNYLVKQNKEALDFGTNNFFGFTRNDTIVEACSKAIDKYGVIFYPFF
jgi:7-keto-8-aminopelargonate synthetase-like enzyme